MNQCPDKAGELSVQGADGREGQGGSGNFDDRTSYSPSHATDVTPDAESAEKVQRKADPGVGAQGCLLCSQELGLHR